MRITKQRQENARRTTPGITTWGNGRYKIVFKYSDEEQKKEYEETYLMDFAMLCSLKLHKASKARGKWYDSLSEEEKKRVQKTVVERDKMEPNPTKCNWQDDYSRYNYRFRNYGKRY